MKSDHRHELKTNELADWLAHFPEWARQNRNNLMAVAAVIILAIIVYFWSFYRSNVVSVRNEVRLTNLVTSIPQQVNSAMRAAMQGTDQSYTLMPIAQDLQEYAGDLSDDNMAALALIKRGETLRAELHLRLADITRDELVKQIGQAQTSYQQALDRKPSNPGLAAAAQFGLGLCEEELGNFDKAAEIYRTTVQKPEYAGTIAQAAAEYRLKVMDDYKSPVVFKPAPPQPQTQTSQGSAPPIQIVPGGPATPTVVPSPGPANVGPVAPTAPAQTTQTPAPTAPPAADTNKPAGG